MKKIFSIVAIALTFFASCKRIESDHLSVGTLSLEQFELNYDTEVITKGGSAASGNYSIFITDSEGKEIVRTTYSAVKSNNGKISLEAGQYTLEARSTEEEVPASAFEQPVYGVRKDFSIKAGETTSIGLLTCTLLQVKATVSYDDAFLEMVTGEGKTTVTVDPSSPLDFPLSYSGGKASYEPSAGYFAVNNGDNTTMNIVFSGKVDGKSQKMVANLTGIAARQWRQIKIVKKVDDQGNNVFSLKINDYVFDEELDVPLMVENPAVIGEDPDKPKGDGGIRIEFAPGVTFTDLENIVVPPLGPNGEMTMNLKLAVTVPNGVRKMTVEMSSTSPSFIDAVALAGGTTLNLIQPSEEQEVVFQIVPFPHGGELAGQTTLEFDLSAAQDAISIFPGKHTFTMKITDTKGCSNSIPVVLVVNQGGNL